MTLNDPAQAPRAASTAPPLILLLITAAVYALTLLFLVDAMRPTPDGGWGFVIVAFLLLPLQWLLLALCARPIGPAALVVLALGAVASFGALALLESEGFPRIAGWSAVVAIPPLVLGFAAWSRSGTGQSSRSRSLVAMGFGVITLALVAGVGVARYQIALSEAGISRAAAAEEAARDAAVDALLARPDTRLEQLLEYIEDEGPPSPDGLYMTGDRRTRVLRGIQRLPSRQADSVRLLGGAASLPRLALLHDFNLEVTPALCEAYRGAFTRQLQTLRASAPDDWQALSETSRQHENLRWLGNGGCDLSPQIRIYAETLRSMPGRVDPMLPREIEEMIPANRSGTARN